MPITLRLVFKLGPKNLSGPSGNFCYNSYFCYPQSQLCIGLKEAFKFVYHLTEISKSVSFLTFFFGFRTDLKNSVSLRTECN